MMNVFDSTPRIRRETVLGVSGALYLLSLTMPAMHFEKEALLSGRSVLAQGWLGLLMLNPAWLANPLYVAAAVQLARSRYTRASQLSVRSVHDEVVLQRSRCDADIRLRRCVLRVARRIVVLLAGSLRLRRESAVALQGK
nr:hypothetical protein [Burkholderia cepacia]